MLDPETLDPDAVVAFVAVYRNNLLVALVSLKSGPTPSPLASSFTPWGSIYMPSFVCLASPRLLIKHAESSSPYGLSPSFPVPTPQPKSHNTRAVRPSISQRINDQSQLSHVRSRPR